MTTRTFRDLSGNRLDPIVVPKREFLLFNNGASIFTDSAVIPAEAGRIITVYRVQLTSAGACQITIKYGTKYTEIIQLSANAPYINDACITLNVGEGVLMSSSAAVQVYGTVEHEYK